MDKAALVTVDLEEGSKFLQILDDAKLKVSVALWMYSPDYEEWRFVLSSRQFDEAGPVGAYGLFHDALDAAGVVFEGHPPALILRRNDPFIRALRRAFGKAKSVTGVRLGGQTIGDRYVEDAYVYRIS